MILIMWLQYVDDNGDFETQCLYNCVLDPDERSEHVFFTRAIWHHHLLPDTKGPGSGVLKRWKLKESFQNNKVFLFENHSGPHFQNNKVFFLKPQFGRSTTRNFG